MPGKKHPSPPRKSRTPARKNAAIPDITSNVRTLAGFLCEFLNQHQQRPDRPFCFILGAGASKESNIPTGQEMAAKWLEEIHLHENIENLELSKWATAERLNIDGFDHKNPARHYSKLYERRYYGNEDGGYAFLESVMEKSEPSFGYSVLAYILGETSHKIVITTNFDNLVADALAVHADNFPVVVTDDALVRYVRSKVRRPLIAKVHGSLGFTPKSKEGDLTLSGDWSMALTEVFRNYTPVVIGYDGNDGSLMSLLESLPKGVPDRIWWCYYSPSGDHRTNATSLPDRIRALIADHNGFLVPIAGFDFLMAELLKHVRNDLSIPDLHDRLREKSTLRLSSYDTQWQNLCGDGKFSPENSAPVSSAEVEDLQDVMQELALARQEKPWWQWQKEIYALATPKSQDALYRQAIETLPKSAQLLGNYANFLAYTRKDHAAAEDYYKRAIAADPKDADYLGNYACFLTDIRKDHAAAEDFYKRAIEVGPKEAAHLGNYAAFLTEVREDHATAEDFYKRAIEAGPKDAVHLGNYANFLTGIRKDYAAAEDFYKRAIAVAPKNAVILGNYANLFKNISKDSAVTDELYKRAINADPKHINNLGNYANFLTDIRKDHDAAEDFYKQAISVEPKNANNLGNYASFLTNIRKDHDTAEDFYKRAVSADPKHPSNLGNYASFLTTIRKDHDAAEDFYKRSIAVTPKEPILLGNYANFLSNIRKNPAAAEDFYQRAISADPKQAGNLGNYGQFLLGAGRVPEGVKLLRQAWEHISKTDTKNGAEIAISLWLGILLNGTEELVWERVFKFYILTNFERPVWNFDAILTSLEEMLPAENYRYATALAEAFLNESKIATLEGFPRWLKLKPLAPLRVSPDGTVGK